MTDKGVDYDWLKDWETLSPQERLNRLYVSRTQRFVRLVELRAPKPIVRMEAVLVIQATLNGKRWSPVWFLIKKNITAYRDAIAFHVRNFFGIKAEDDD